MDFGALFAAGEAEEEETAGMRELVLLLREAFGERLFSAADLAALLQAPGVAAVPHYGGPWDGAEQRAAEAAERAQALRAALEGATGKALPPGAAATARLVGKRLQMVVGRPVALGDGEVGTVVKAHAGHEANAYRVAIVPGVGAHDRARKSRPVQRAAPRHSRLSRHSRAPRERRESRECDGGARRRIRDICA